MLLAVVSHTGELIGIFTSGVDAHLQQKSVLGSRTWRCAPNSSHAEEITPCQISTVREESNGTDPQGSDRCGTRANDTERPGTPTES